jgi:hypothetical protein
MRDVDDDLKQLLRTKAGEMQSSPRIPGPVLRRSKRRRIGTALVAGTLALGLGAGAFVGARDLLDSDATTSHRVPAAAPVSSHEIWLTSDHHLFLTHADTPDTPRDALQRLLRGPTDEQSGAGVASAIAGGTELANLTVEDGIASVDFSTHVESDPLADAQVVYTLTQFPDVKRVLVNDQEGGPLSRADLADQLPPILVEQPEIGDEVTSPVTIAGTANVYEANVTIEIYAEEQRIVQTFTTASCGTGCRGRYSDDVAFSVPQATPGTIVLYEASGENGQPLNMVRIPVTLEPSTLGAGSEESTTWIPPQDVDATTPDATALAFASQVLGWRPDRVIDRREGTGDEALVSMWNEDMTSPLTPGTETTLRMHRGATGWVVLDVTTALFDVTCPSPREDVIVTTEPVEICGTFAQQPSGYIVKATLEYAGSDLNGSEAQSTADIPVQGQTFHGNLDLIATYANSDVTLQIRVYSGSGHTLGLYVRRFATETG